MKKVTSKPILPVLCAFSVLECMLYHRCHYILSFPVVVLSRMAPKEAVLSLVVVCVCLIAMAFTFLWRILSNCYWYLRHAQAVYALRFEDQSILMTPYQIPSALWGLLTCWCRTLPDVHLLGTLYIYIYRYSR